jgi:putative transposase
VGRLMRQNAICVVRSRKFKATTDSDHTFNIAPNLLQQDFAASQPNQKWAGDITYVWTREGWVYRKRHPRPIDFRLSGCGAVKFWRI